ncbi:hypothetical protein WJX81_000411 [Elliptochloris bilobata]|uniref:PH domain-containing protein n=1 Tax=Elliptochloris bilobata TaxID=381761 RepID=A0AAW1RKL6_9CHLO
MLEAQLAYYLNRYLGTYVEGLNQRDLKVSVFRGDVVLKNLKLKPEALADLNLPISIKAGLLGSLTLKIPWASLGKSAVVVIMDRLYILAGPKDDTAAPGSEEEDFDELERAAKKRRVEDAEMAAMQSKYKTEASSDGGGGGGMLRGLIDTVIGNLRLSITNVHIRYEDDYSNPGTPFAVGLTLESLSAHTVDEAGKEAFVTQDPLKLLRKAAQLRRLALYFDVGAELWRPKAAWGAMALADWNGLFQPGVAEGPCIEPVPEAQQQEGAAAEAAEEQGRAEEQHPKEGGTGAVEAGAQFQDTDELPLVREQSEAIAAAAVAAGGLGRRTYMLRPVDGRLRYTRRGREARTDEAQAVQDADVELDALSLHLAKAQYQSLQKLLAEFNAYSARAPNRLLRPAARPHDASSARRWWRYAAAAVKRLLPSRRFDWQQLEKALLLRKGYVEAYTRCLEGGQVGGDKAVAAMDDDLNEATILVFRRLAHAKVDAAKKRAAAAKAAERRAKASRGWTGWLWGSGRGTAAAEGGTGAEEADADAEMRGDLAPEDEEALKELATEQEDALRLGEETAWSLRAEIRTRVGSAALVLDGPGGERVLRAGLEGLAATTKLYPKTLAVRAAVAAMGVVAPEGTLVRTGGRLHPTPSFAVAPSEAGAAEDVEDTKGEGGSADASADNGAIAVAQLHRQALLVQLVQAPQDGSADTAVRLALAPSYVTYLPAAVERVLDFFRTEQAVDLSALGAQAAAGVERARAAAREQLAAALGTRPRLALRMELDGPKVAVPVPATDTQRALTLVLDLGSLLMESDTESPARLPAEAAALYQCLRLTSRDISAYLVDGIFSFAALERAGASQTGLDLQGSPVTEAISAAVERSAGVALGGAATFIPLLERCGTETLLQVAQFPHPTLPTLRAQLSVPALRFFFSAARVQRLMRVLRFALPKSAPVEATPTAGGAAGPADGQQPLWQRDAEKAGPMRALEWGGVTRTAASWARRWGVLHRGCLYLLEAQDAPAAASSANIWLNKRIVHVPPEACGGARHVVAVCPEGTETARAAQDKGSLLLRFASRTEAEDWHRQLLRSQQQTLAVAGRDPLSHSADAAAFESETGSSLGAASDGGGAPDAGASAAAGGAADEPPVSISVSAELGELAVFVSGRTADVWWPPEDLDGGSAGTDDGGTLALPSASQVVNVDGERALVVVRATGSSADAALGAAHTAAGVAVGSFEIEDLLVGARCPAHAYLARSFEAPSAGSTGNTDEVFFDAATEPPSPRSSGSLSRASMGAESFFSAAGPSELEGGSLGAGKGSPQGSGLARAPPAWALDFETWARGSAEYAGVDSELRMRLTTLFFFLNRPTVAALMAVGSAMAAAVKDPDVNPDPDTDPDPAKEGLGREAAPQTRAGPGSGLPEGADEGAEAAQDASTASPSEAGDAGTLVLEGGAERVIFRLLVEVERLEATLNYESATAPPLALASVEDVRLSLRVQPATLRLAASLGNLRAQDGALPEGHPYRSVCDLRSGAATSLVELEFASHTPEEADESSRVPPGLPFFSIRARMNELDIVFLNRFLMEILQYISVLLALQPAPAQGAAGAPADGAQAAAAAGASQASAVKGKSTGTLLLLDVEMVAPVITMPRCSDSRDALEVDLGHLQMRNALSWRGGAGAGDKKAVLLEEDWVVLRDMGAYVAEGGHRGDNLIRDYDAGMRIRLRRPLRDRFRRLPAFEVGLAIPSIKAALSDREFALITSVAGANVSEPLRIPAAALWLEERVLQHADADGEDADATAAPSQAGEASAPAERTTVRVVVDIGKSELELLRTVGAGPKDLAPLARFAVGSLWVAFRLTEAGDMALSLSLPRMEGIDLRPWVPPEHSLVVSSARSALRTGGTDGGGPHPDLAGGPDAGAADGVPASFLAIEWHGAAGMAKQKLQVRLQRPTVSAEMSFLLEVITFLVPNLALDGAKTAPFRMHDLLLTGPVHKAESDLWLSPETRLLADAPGCDSFEYDGAGHRLVLPEGLGPAEALPLILVGEGRTLLLRNVRIVHAASLAACLQLSAGAQLVAHPANNVHRVDGADPDLDAEPGLGSLGGSSGGSFGGSPGTRQPRFPGKRRAGEAPKAGAAERAASGTAALAAGSAAKLATRIELELVALGMGLRFVELSGGQQKGEPLRSSPSGGGVAAARAAAARRSEQEGVRSARLLAAYMDLSAGCMLAGERLTARAELGGLRVETQVTLGEDDADTGPQNGRVQGAVLEPCKVSVSADLTAGSGDIQVALSDLRMNLSPDVVELALALQSSVLQPLMQPPSDKPLVRCARFERVWSNAAEAADGASAAVETDAVAGERGVTVWRPQAPAGYVALGDCITAGAQQPSFQVVAVALKSGFVARPAAYSRAGSAAGLTLWLPDAPEGYAALGCVAAPGDAPPPVAAGACVHRGALVEAALGEFLLLKQERSWRGRGQDVGHLTEAPGAHLWRVENAAGTFLACSPEDGSPAGPFVDLRSPLGIAPAALQAPPAAASVNATAYRHAAPMQGSSPTGTPKSSGQSPNASRAAYERFADARGALLQRVSRRLLQNEAVDFRRLWTDRGARGGPPGGLSLWRPVAPAGYAALGDCLRAGPDPPESVTVLLDTELGEEPALKDPLLKPPQGYELVWADDAARPERRLAFWRPVPYEGYVAMGCVMGRGSKPPSRQLVRCLSAKAVARGDSGSGRPLVKMPSSGRRAGFAAWPADSRLGTFVVTHPEGSPSPGEALRLCLLEELLDRKLAPRGSQATAGGRINVVLKSGASSLLVRDALRRPLAELELGEVSAGLSRSPPAVMQAYLGVRLSVWSYNALVTTWEPVLEPWDVIAKADLNSSAAPALGVAPGLHISVKSTSDRARLTLAYSAAAAALRALRQWGDLNAAAGAGGAWRRQLAAADAASVHSRLTNALGVPAQLQLDFGDRVVVAELPPERTTTVLEPLPLPPARHSQRAAQPADALPPPLLIVDVLELANAPALLGAVEGSDGGPLCPPELCVNVAVADEGPQGVGVEVTVRDAAAAGGVGAALARAVVRLDLKSWGLEARDATIQLSAEGATQGADPWEHAAAGASLSLRWAFAPTPRGAAAAVTDAWTSAASTAGQRALRLAGESAWSPVSASAQAAPGAPMRTQNLKSSNGGRTLPDEVAPVRLAGDGVALESTFEGGSKRELLRALCQVENGTELALEVALAELPPGERPRSDDGGSTGAAQPSPRADVVAEEVFENERFMPLRGWGARGNLLPGERGRFSTRSGARSWPDFPDVRLPDGWQWEGPWEVEVSRGTDPSGWSYAVDWGGLSYPPPPSAAYRKLCDFVRRRHWLRRRRRVLAAEGGDVDGRGLQRADSVAAAAAAALRGEAGTPSVLGVVQPGACLPLPYGWRTCGKQLVVRPVPEEGKTPAHTWSLGASNGEHALRLDTLEEGATRLLACPALRPAPPPGADAPSAAEAAAAARGGAASAASALAAATVWLSAVVEADAFLEDPGGGGEGLTDWRLVLAPPLVLINQLPMGATFLVWEAPGDGASLVMRQSGSVPSGGRVAVHAADMRGVVSAQLYPDGYEWVDARPLALSQGYASRRAGVDGRQALPDEFAVARSTGSEPPQPVYVMRELDLDARQRADKDLDPGAAVALGAPMSVRVFVPLWVINATPLPMSAFVVALLPPPKAERERESREDGVAADAGEATRLRVLEADPRTAGVSPAGARDVPPESVAMVAYPLQQLAAFKADGAAQRFGLRLRIGSSGWTEPLPLEGADGTEDMEARPALIRAAVPAWGALYELVARLELLGSDFERTLALRLEPRVVLSNRTGVPLQLLQPRPGATEPAAGIGLMPVPATPTGLPRVGGARAGAAGLRTALSDASSAVDWAACMDLPPGALGVPLHWSLPADARVVCLRLAPESRREAGPAWSNPIEPETLHPTPRHIGLPALPPPGACASSDGSRGPSGDGGPGEGTNAGGARYLRALNTLQAAGTPSWELRGRQLRPLRGGGPNAEGTLAGAAVALRLRTELRAPGCLHAVAEAVAAAPPYLLENRSGSPLRYRQAGTPGAPFLPLPPFSAAGFVWQVLPREGERPRLEIADAYAAGGTGAGIAVELDPPLARSGDAEAADGSASVHGGAAAGPQTLTLASGARLQAAVADRELTVMGRGARSALPGGPTGGPTAEGTEEGGSPAMHLSVDVSALEVSVVDHRPQELLAISVAGAALRYGAGLGAGGDFSRLRLAIDSVQVDDQMIGSRFPVVLCALLGSEAGGPLVQLTLVSQAGGARGRIYFPFIAFRVTRPLQVAVAEPLVWRAVECVQRLDLCSASAATSSGARRVAAATDTPLAIALMAVADLTAYVSFRGDQLSRPRWASRMGALSWGLDLATFEGVPVRLHGFEMTNVAMLSSVFVGQLMRQVRGQLVGVALSFLRNFGVLSGASGVLGRLSASVAALGGGGPWAAEERLSARQARNIGGVGEGLVEGGEALAQGFLRGVTGLVQRPLQGAAQAGVGGFVKGVGKGLLGVAAQPMSGALDFMSSAFEGIDVTSGALRTRLGKSALARARQRLPRAIGGDRRLLPFLRSDGTDRQACVEAVGQALMWRASAAATGPLGGLARRPRRGGAAAPGEAYEEHFLLPDDRVALLTSHRLLLVLAPGFAAVHAAAAAGATHGSEEDVPAGQIRWAIEWRDLLALELRWTHRELPHPDRLTVHRKGSPGEEEDEPLAHELRCFPNSPQAEQLRAVALTVAAKYTADPLRARAATARARAAADPLAELASRRSSGSGLGDLPPQALPALMPSLEYRLQWHARGGSGMVSVWRPVAPPGYAPLGDVATLGREPPPQPVQVYRDESATPGAATAHAADFHLVYRHNGHAGFAPVTLWEPIAPEGYAALGTLAVGAPEPPAPGDALCVRRDRVSRTVFFDSPLWACESAALQGGPSLQRLNAWDPRTWRCSLWQVDNVAATFIAERGARRPRPEVALSATLGCDS